MTFLRWLHRWIGLTLGLVLVLICATGTALLFQEQFFRWAHGDLIPEGMSPEVGSIDGWVKSANAVATGFKGPLYIWTPHTDHNVSDAGMLFYRSGEPGGFGRMGFTAVLVAPTTGDVLGIVDIDRSPAYAPIFLHGRLWAGPAGLVVVAVAAVGGLVLCLSGLYLWWPPLSRLAKKLSPRPWKNTLTYAGRLHDWTGAWSLLLLIVVAITGVYMARADWLEPALRLFHNDPVHDAHQEPVACAEPISLDRAIEQAQPLVSGSTLVALEADYASAGRRWTLVFKPPGARSSLHETRVLADVSCGTVARVSSPEERAPRHSAEMVLAGLHDGTLFGLPGEIFVSLLGLVPLVLAWSGIRRWLRGRRNAAERANVARSR